MEAEGKEGAQAVQGTASTVPTRVGQEVPTTA